MSATRNFNFKPLVNTRTQKDEFSTNLIATSIVGGFRVPPKVATILGVEDYSAVSIFSDVNEETGETEAYIAKGHDGTILRDADGKVVTGSRNTTEFDENDPMSGAIVRTTAEGSKVLSFTSSATWKMLGGSQDHELVLDLESIGVLDYPLPNGEFRNGEVFQIKVKETRKVNSRRPKVAGEAGDVTVIADDADIAQAIAEEEYEEEEV